MIDPATQAQLKEAIADCIRVDSGMLHALRNEIRPLRQQTRRIQPRAATSISLVATDGGNNQLRFDPFLIQLVRVVDSSNNEYCLETLSPATPVEKLEKRQFHPDNSPRTPLGEMMAALGTRSLSELSHMIRPPKQSDQSISPTWVQAYRDLVEWATLFSILKKDFGTDTLIIRDGLLRSLVFAHDLFPKLLDKIQERIEARWTRSKRRIYLAGVAKHSQVLTRYRLALALEGVLQTDYPAYVEVPRDVEERAYQRAEHARGDDWLSGGEVNRYVGGKMFLVKFGCHRLDPVWPVDIFTPQRENADIILGSMLADAVNGFPVPCYPLCLQKAHDHAALVDFDFDILRTTFTTACVTCSAPNPVLLMFSVCGMLIRRGCATKEYRLGGI